MNTLNALEQEIKLQIPFDYPKEKNHNNNKLFKFNWTRCSRIVLRIKKISSEQWNSFLAQSAAHNMNHKQKYIIIPSFTTTTGPDYTDQKSLQIIIYLKFPANCERQSIEPNKMNFIAPKNISQTWNMELERHFNLFFFVFYCCQVQWNHCITSTAMFVVSSLLLCYLYIMDDSRQWKTTWINVYHSFCHFCVCWIWCILALIIRATWWVHISLKQ